MANRVLVNNLLIRFKSLGQYTLSESLMRQNIITREINKEMIETLEPSLFTTLVEYPIVFLNLIYVLKFVIEQLMISFRMNLKSFLMLLTYLNPFRLKNEKRKKKI